MDSYSLNVTDRNNTEIVEKCEEIALQNHVKNGGTLRYLGLVRGADYLIFIKDSHNDVVAFASLNKSFILKKDIYVMQVAVEKNHQRLGLGTKLYKYLIRHSKGYKYITSNVKKNNVASNCLHRKLGFKIIGEMGDDYLYAYKTNKILNRNMKLTINQKIKMF